MGKQISCSIGILTLNSASTLRRCLEPLRDFAEVIVCDGNSTDETLAIAKEFGVKIIKQYDSDEPNLRCVKDKANVRDRNMAAASYDWYMFMDADDALLPETVEEIRNIVENPDPPYGIYRMPSRIFLDGVRKFTSVEPAYQIRLFRRSIGARFKGDVHDHIVFDRKKYPLGTMKSFYDFQISSARIQNYWKYQKEYSHWELDAASFGSFVLFLYWGVYRRLRIAAGFLLYRIPKLYITHGFKNSMPLKYEFLTMWQHVYLLGLMTMHLPELLRKSKA